MSVKEYFSEEKHINNSYLGNLKSIVDGGFMSSDPSEAFRRGSAFDEMITQPDLDVVERYNLTKEEVDRMLKMRASWLSDGFNKSLAMLPDKQYAIYDALDIDYKGFHFTVKGKCLCDFYRKQVKMVADLKTTASTTDRSWRSSIDTFAYYRQAAWYLDVSKSDLFYLRAVSHVAPHKLFNTLITRDSEYYKRGKEEYSRLCFIGYVLFNDTIFDEYFEANRFLSMATTYEEAKSAEEVTTRDVFAPFIDELHIIYSIKKRSK